MPAVLLVAMLRLPSTTFTTRFPPTQAYMAQFPAILRTVYTSSGPSSPDDGGEGAEGRLRKLCPAVCRPR